MKLSNFYKTATLAFSLISGLLVLGMPTSAFGCEGDDHFFIVQCDSSSCARGFEVNSVGDTKCEDYSATLKSLPSNYLEIFYKPLLILNPKGLEKGLYAGRVEPSCLPTIRHLMDTLPPDHIITWKTISPAEVIPEEKDKKSKAADKKEPESPPNPLASCNFSLQEYSLGAGYLGYIQSYLYWSLK